jgi:ribonuclease D
MDNIVSFSSTQNDEDGKEETELRYMPSLMDVLSSSQRQCLRLWTEKKEPPEKAENLLLMMQRADRFSGSKKKVWNKADMSLYYKLVNWRDDVAKKTGTMPLLVCTLNLLVLVAYQRPTSVTSLQKLNYVLPALLRDQTDLLQEMFAIIHETESNDQNNVDTHEKDRRLGVFNHRLKVATLLTLIASYSVVIIMRKRKK